MTCKYRKFYSHITFIFVAVFLFFFFTSRAFANNLSITNVSLEDRDPTNNTVVVQFDISWDNSWRNKINHDAVWVTVRFTNVGKLCDMAATGLDPSGSSPGSNSNLEIYVPSDYKGAFIRPKDYQAMGSVSSTNVELKISYNGGGSGSNACISADSDSITATVYGTEMVFIPEGAFYAGDYSTTTAGSLRQGTADYDPWYITSESTIITTNAGADGYHFVSGGTGDYATGYLFTIRGTFPKGYKAFYCMKYEMTEGQWVAFVNALGSEELSNRDITAAATSKNTDAVANRNTVSCQTLDEPWCSTLRPDRAMTYLRWSDLVAFLDWAALRPMTSLEFEKIARGPLIPVPDEYAWGTTSLTQAVTFSISPENGTETITTSGANINYGDQSFLQGDYTYGAQHRTGALRAGIFATSTSDRASAGAGYYGVMEMSGNARESAITFSYSTGMGSLFTGNHGDGQLTTIIIYSGNANVSGWVAFNATSSRGITSATGSGHKGSGLGTTSLSQLRISDRALSSNPDNNLGRYYYGGRGVRTYDGP